MFKGLYNYFYFSGYSFIGFFVGTGWLFFLPDSIYIVIGGYIFAGYFQCTYLHKDFMDKKSYYDYPGREISDLVQKRWDKNFINNISIVVGDEWYAGNLSYHLSSRPTWFNTIENNLSLVTSDTGVIYIGNPNVLKKFCPGVYGTIKPIGICMIGAK